jgi:uncharacterized protein (TIGR00297 family)
VVKPKLAWQSKLVLLVVAPFAGTHVLLESIWYAQNSAAAAIWTIGLSALLGLVIWKLRAATPAAAATGALLMASLMFSTAGFPFEPWHTALIPTLGVTFMAFAATRLGRQKKERLGIAEGRRGRGAAQVAANLGLAALAASGPVQVWLLNSGFVSGMLARLPIFALSLAALAEAAADTVSSEIGQAFGVRPRMITNWRSVEPGRDGAVTVAGTLAGVLAAAAIAGAGTWALRRGWHLFWISCAGGVFGLFFDSLLGATVERRGWLNNDAVNFVSTASAAAFALLLLAIVPHPGAG